MAARVLTNDFSWSKSRHEKFSECLRAYYLYYYRSWGGWERQAPNDVRELYLLKKLHNRYTWAGSMVHDTVKEALLEIRAGRRPQGERFIERAHRLMQTDYRHSSSKAYRKEKLRKQFAGLVEHEYDEGVTPDSWRQNWETVKGALTWFFASRWPRLATELGGEQWLEVDENDFDKSVFHLEGVKVFAVPDFAYRESDGTPVVVDWKTGKARDGYEEQVLGYSLYLSARYGFPAQSVRAELVYLNEGVEKQVEVHPEAIDRFHLYFRGSVERMRGLLSDARGNLPREEQAFAATEDLSTCGRCVFRRVCGRA